jgi:hypothetical protein
MTGPKLKHISAVQFYDARLFSELAGLKRRIQMVKEALDYAIGTHTPHEVKLSPRHADDLNMILEKLLAVLDKL